MSLGKSPNVTAALRFFGFILFIVGAVFAYFTFTSSDVLSIYTGLFAFLSFALVIIGLLMVIAKTET
ncbi:MAG: hypothetical protein QXY75_02220 [Candidatus Bathyarchaeia archaeon]